VGGREGEDRGCKGSVVDPDPKGSKPFSRIRIRILGSDPDPELKGSEYKFLK